MDRLAGILIILILALGIIGIISSGDDDDKTPDKHGPDEARIVFDEGLLIYCELAETESEKVRGLMDRTNLPEDQGMLFVYDPPEPSTIWMKDTYIDLDIIFIGENLTVTGIHEADAGAGMADSELPLYPSNGDVAYILEMNQGLSEEFGIVVGSGVEIHLR